jgi:hypothetical protein
VLGGLKIEECDVPLRRAHKAAAAPCAIAVADPDCAAVPTGDDSAIIDGLSSGGVFRRDWRHRELDHVSIRDDDDKGAFVAELKQLAEGARDLASA